MQRLHYTNGLQKKKKRACTREQNGMGGGVCVHVCVCVSEREREGKQERGYFSSFVICQ